MLTNDDKREIVNIIKRYRSVQLGSNGGITILGRIPILSTAPSPVAGILSLWIDATNYATGTDALMNNGIQLVFPDGTNMNMAIPFSNIPS
jgi:hypothetical protein